VCYRERVCINTHVRQICLFFVWTKFIRISDNDNIIHIALHVNSCIHIYVCVCVCDSVCVTCLVDSPRFCPLFFWTKLIIINDNDNIIHNDLHVNSCMHRYMCVCVCRCMYHMHGRQSEILPLFFWDRSTNTQQ